MSVLVAVVERRVHDVGVDVDGVARAEHLFLALDPLLDLPGLDDDHLLLVDVLVERVAATGAELHVEHGDRAARPVRLGTQRQSTAPQSNSSWSRSLFSTNLLIVCPFRRLRGLP